MKIKEMLKQFGILVIRLVWGERANKRAQPMGVMLLGIGILFGVSRASAIQNAIASLIGGKAAVAVQTVQVNRSSADRLTEDVTAATEPAPEGDSGAVNIVDLIADSDVILRGAVKEVTDGFENGVPYTQVTITVDEALRGQVGNEYTFRQFGLTKPRSLGNGKVYLGVTPEGWAKYKVGEDAMFFLYRQASITGLQTTVGLGQGKVVFNSGNATSQFDNEGLFESVEVDSRLLNDKDKRLLATKKGAVNAEGFKSFVRRAVNGRWIEGGKMRHANN